MPLDTALSANGTIFANTNVVVDIGPDLYANNIYYRTLKGSSGPSNFGYRSGGGAQPVTNTIDRFPFALAITNASDVGDLILANGDVAGQSSLTYGYISGGLDFNPVTGPSTNVIQRFPFALSITNTADVGDLLHERYGVMGTESASYGYTLMGYDPNGPATYDYIERFPFALSITNSVLVGATLTQDYTLSESTASSTYGYINGSGPAYISIERFPFSVENTDSVNVGNLTVGRYGGSGQESDDYGYSSGGFLYPTPLTATGSNIIDRFPFASSITNAADVGDLTVGRTQGSGQSSTTYGYSSGGMVTRSPVTASNVIDRFPFALSITNATDVGDLTQQVLESPAGQQY